MCACVCVGADFVVIRDTLRDSPVAQVWEQYTISYCESGWFEQPNIK